MGSGWADSEEDEEATFSSSHRKGHGSWEMGWLSPGGIDGKDILGEASKIIKYLKERK